MLSLLKDKIRVLNTDYAEIHAEVVTSTRIVYSNNNIEAVLTLQSSSGNARVLSCGGWGFASFNDMDFDRSLKLALDNASLTSRFRKGDKSRVRLLPRPVEEKILTTFEKDPASWTLSEKNELARRYNEILKHPDIASTRVTYADWKVDKYFVNSEGSAIEQSKVFCGVSYGAMAKDGSNVQQAFESVGQYGGLELVTGREAQVETVRRRALDLLKAPKVDSGKYTVLLDPNLAGTFVHEAFGHLSESDFLYENPRMQEVMVMGREFGPSFLNIVDDGSLVNLAGYTPYDDEGVPARRNYLIKNGKLNARLHSRETAEKLGEELSGNARAISPTFQPIVRMTNTLIENGTVPFEDMIAGIDDGLYCVDYLGGMTNLEMFTFSSGYAYRIKNGRLGGLVRDVNLSGNVFSTMHNITAVGNDIEYHGGLGGCGKGGQGGLPVATGSPHIVIKDVLVGGV